MSYKVLSPGHTNTKINKNDTEKYISTILHLAPSTLSGYNVCPAASEGCKKACLNTAGLGGVFSSIQQARIRKTKLFFENRQSFMQTLLKDLEKLSKQAIKQQKKAVCRLNGTSDIDWENIYIQGKNVFELFPSIQFYDYTKRPDRLLKNTYSNYHLTFSRSENNDKLVTKVLKKGFNVAVVFSKDLPKYFKNYEVINGDNTDLRFLDKANVVIGLTAKGKARKDHSGFVITA